MESEDNIQGKYGSAEPQGKVAQTKDLWAMRRSQPDF
jgi:hypothetical protein